MRKFILLTLLCGSLFVHAAQLPAGFSEQLLAQNLDPTDMVLTNDGRVFITIKSGKVLVVENGKLLDTPLLSIGNAIDNFNERGLGHIVLDPDFDINGYYYVYFTVKAKNQN